MHSNDRVDAKGSALMQRLLQRSTIACLFAVAASGCGHSDPSSKSGQSGPIAAGAGGFTQTDSTKGSSAGRRISVDSSGTPSMAGAGGLSGSGGTLAAMVNGGSGAVAGDLRTSSGQTTGGQTTAGQTNSATAASSFAGGGTMAGGTSALGGGAGPSTSTSGGAAAGSTAWSAAGAAPSGGASNHGCSATMGEYCLCMPRFIGTQVLDGIGDEFSGLAPMTFALSAARYVNPSRASALPEIVTLRAAWSDLGMHVHVHVEDPSIVPDPSATLWNGDNLQLFVAPTDNLTGTYTGAEDGGAIHVLISAPDPAGGSRATVIYQNGVSSNAPFVTGLYATRRVSGGYEIEAQLQWLPIANPRQSGARIGFDVLVGAAADPSQGLALEGGLANNPVSASSPACDLGGRVQPGCDDRTWCRPLLQ